MGGALEAYSHRVGVSVSLAMRLFDPAVERDPANRPTQGPAAREPGEPTMRQIGAKGASDSKRVWTVGPPASGASPTAQSEGEEGTGPVLVGGDGDQHIVLTDLLPRRVRLRMNPHRVSDESEIELPIEALPFPADGSLIRSILVEVRRGVIAADDWADALSHGALAADGRPLTIPVATAGDDPDFVGFVDKHQIRFGDAASTVVLPCRDLSSVLADHSTRGRAIETHLPADQAIARFLSTIPAAVGFEVLWLGGSEPPVLAASSSKAKGPKSGPPLPRASRDARMSCLDAITDYCTLCAVTPRFRGYRLELGPAITLDQFSAATAPRLLFGANVDELELEHHLTRAQTRAVEVRSFSYDSGAMLVARWPDDPARFGMLPPGQVNALPPSGPLEVPPGASGIDESPPTVMIVQNVTDPRRLQDIARNLFEEVARQDVSLRARTRDVATVDGRASGVADLLALNVGDPIAIEIAPSVEEQAGSFVQRLASMAPAEAVEVLVGAGYRRSVAERVVDGVLTMRRPLVYRVREIEFEWSLDGGTSTEIRAVNYVEVVDREYRKGGSALAKLPPGASREAKWDAIEEAMESGEIPVDRGLEMQATLGAR